MELMVKGVYKWTVRNGNVNGTDIRLPLPILHRRGRARVRFVE